jgi:hypothetical protein
MTDDDTAARVGDEGGWWVSTTISMSRQLNAKLKKRV